MANWIANMPRKTKRLSCNVPNCATAKRLGLETANPLIPIAADPGSPTPRFPLAIRPGAFVVTRLLPSLDGKAWIMRLFNASSGPEKLILSGEAFDQGRVFLSDLRETQGPPLSLPLDVPGFGILTLLIR